MTTDAHKTQTYYGVSLADLLSAGLLNSALELAGARGGVSYSAKVLDDGHLVIADGSVFSSPSAAGAKAMNVEACSGWTSGGHPPPRDRSASRLRQTFTETKAQS